MSWELQKGFSWWETIAFNYWAKEEVLMEGIDPRAKLFLIAFGTFALFLLILIISHDYRRRKGLIALAKELGFTYEREATQLLQHFKRFRLFPAGSNQRFMNVLKGETGSATVCLLDYSYFRTGHRKYSVCVLRSPDLKLPYFHFTCQIPVPGVDKLGSFLVKKGILPGSRDVNFSEDENFSKKFLLQGQEEAKIRLLFDLDLRQYLLRFAGTLVTIEGDRDTLLFTDGEPVLPKAAREVIRQTTDLFTLFSQRTASLREGLSGADAKDRIPMKEPSEGTGAEKMGRGSSIPFKGIVFLIGTLLAAAGSVIIFTEIHGIFAGRTDPLSNVYIIGLAFFVVGLGIVLKMTLGRALKRRSAKLIKRELEDMSVIEGSADNNKAKKENRGLPS